MNTITRGQAALPPGTSRVEPLPASRAAHAELAVPFREPIGKAYSMEASIYLRDKDGGFRSIGYFLFEEQEYDWLKNDWLAYLKNGSVKGGAYKCCQVASPVASAANSSADVNGARTEKVLLLRFDDIVYIG